MNINDGVYDSQAGGGGQPYAQYEYDPYGGEYYGEEDYDEEMAATERELAEDAQWKLIQKNTFTRWANEHLKLVNKNIAELDIDLSDGLKFIALVEVLSGKKFQKYNRRPNFRTQKLENVTMALKFLEEDEGIKIVNIGGSIFVVGWKFYVLLRRVVGRPMPYAFTLEPFIWSIHFYANLCGAFR